MSSAETSKQYGLTGKTYFFILWGNKRENMHMVYQYFFYKLSIISTNIQLFFHFWGRGIGPHPVTLRHYSWVLRRYRKWFTLLFLSAQAQNRGGVSRDALFTFLCPGEYTHHSIEYWRKDVHFCFYVLESKITRVVAQVVGCLPYDPHKPG